MGTIYFIWNTSVKMESHHFPIEEIATRVGMHLQQEQLQTQQQTDHGHAVYWSNLAVFDMHLVSA